MSKLKVSSSLVKAIFVLSGDHAGQDPLMVVRVSFDPSGSTIYIPPPVGPLRQNTILPLYPEYDRAHADMAPAANNPVASNSATTNVRFIPPRSWLGSVN